MAESDEVDIVGIVLYSMFFLLVCWRVKPFFARHEGLSQTDRLKLGFHACLLGSALLELGENHSWVDEYLGGKCHPCTNHDRMSKSG